MRVEATLAGLVWIAWSTAASADVPPDPRHIDAQCSLEAQCPGGRTCPAGQRVDLEQAQRCEREADAAGFRYRCHFGGNYEGSSIYCPAGAPGACTVEAQCPRGIVCRVNQDCDTAGRYERCATQVPGTNEWIRVLCPNDGDPPPPGQNASSSTGCGACAATGRRSTQTGCALSGAALALAWIRRIARGKRGPRRRGRRRGEWLAATDESAEPIHPTSCAPR